LNKRHRYLLRALMGPGALLFVAALAHFAIKIFDLDLQGDFRWLVVATLLAFVLILVVTMRVENSLNQRNEVRNRERSLVDQQRAFDRLHAGVQHLRSDPGKTRWLKLTEERRVTDPEVIAGWEQRYQELLAHPTRNPFAAEALRGNFPSDVEIDYESNPSLLLTCIHLHPIESAIRKAGIYCSALSPTSIVTFASLHYSLPSFIEWEEMPETASEPGNASLVCRQCGSRIQSGSGEPFPP
jgi:hypothetical protein